MKKSKYISKYDYINYFVQQKAFWFFTNAEILSAINTELKKINYLNDEDDDEDENDGHEFDAYEYYKELKDQLKDIDKNDPKIFEGIIIDKKSREFIVDEFKEIKKVIDFEDPKYKQFSQEEIAELTKQYIQEKEPIILFQPIFIANNLITKPDAIVIKNDYELMLIETKCTTTAKRHHLLDVFFQYKVLTRIDYLEDYAISLNLCLVAYCYANKNEVKLIITDCFNINKCVQTKNASMEIKQLVKLGYGIYKPSLNKYIEAKVYLTNICEQQYKDLEYRLEIFNSPQARKTINEAIIHFNEIHENFDHVIHELQTHKDKLLKENLLEIIENIQPSVNEKSYWKNSDLFAKLRELYYRQGYNMFKFSGNIVNQTADFIRNTSKHMDLSSCFKKPEYQDYFSQYETIINRSSLDNLLSILKSRKVYFDFETINCAVRPIDHCLPFMQILTQCSVIIDDESTPIKDIQCNNILLDPKNITIKDFKEIVDAIYMGHGFSYIVYNKTFEASRLKELKQFINEEAYNIKIDIIIENLYDLADFFKVHAKQFPCPIIIPELYGFYSIKKVLPIVMKKQRKIFDETGCIDYHDLNVVQNGLICQSETTKRFFNIINDKEWEKLGVNLKKYCENDVRAMVAVEYYVKYIAR